MRWWAAVRQYRRMQRRAEAEAVERSVRRRQQHYSTADEGVDSSTFLQHQNEAGAVQNSGGRTVGRQWGGGGGGGGGGRYAAAGDPSVLEPLLMRLPAGVV